MSSMIARPSWLALMSRKTSSSAPVVLVAARDLDRIAGVAQVEEVDPLDDPAAVDVETGNDAFGQHLALARRAAHSRTSLYDAATGWSTARRAFPEHAKRRGACDLGGLRVTFECF